jgi:hypothetical protein
MMRLFLSQQYPTKSPERSRSFYQPLLNASKDYLTQTFKDYLLGQERFQEIPTGKRIVKNSPILFQNGKKWGIAQMFRCQPGNRTLKHQCMHRFLFGLAEEKSARSGILGQRGLSLRAIMGHSLAMLQKGQESCDRHFLIRTDQHGSVPWAVFR